MSVLLETFFLFNRVKINSDHVKQICWWYARDWIFWLRCILYLLTTRHESVYALKSLAIPTQKYFWRAVR
jgi:hypothetical protein